MTRVKIVFVRFPLLFGLLGLLCAQAAGAETMPGASAESLVWYVPTRGLAEGDEVGLFLHVHSGFSGATAAQASSQRVAKLRIAPDLLAAWEDRVWLAFAPAEGGASRWTVFSVDAVPAGSTGFYADQSTRLQSEPGPTGDGRPIAFIGTTDGPVLLWRSDAGECSLRRLLGGQWRESAVPNQLRTAGMMHAAAAGAGGNTVFVVGGRPGDDASILATRVADGPWTTRRLPGVLPERLEALLRVGTQAVLATRSDDDAFIELAYVRSDSLEPFGRVEVPAAPWKLLGVDDGVVLLRDDGDGVVRRVAVDGASGAVQPIQLLARPQLHIFDLIRVPLLFALAVVALVTVLVVRPTEPGMIVLPDGVEIARLGRRAAALLIDLAPAAIAAPLILGESPRGLLELPFVQPDARASLPYLLMIAITMLHVIPCDLAGVPTFGKRLLGLRMTDLGGARPGRAARLRRMGVKLLGLLVPPLAVLILLSPHRQALHDLAASTLIVRDTEAGSDAAPN